MQGERGERVRVRGRGRGEFVHRCILRAPLANRPAFLQLEGPTRSLFLPPSLQPTPTSRIVSTDRGQRGQRGVYIQNYLRLLPLEAFSFLLPVLLCLSLGFLGLQSRATGFMWEDGISSETMPGIADIRLFGLRNQQGRRKRRA